MVNGNGVVIKDGFANAAACDGSIITMEADAGADMTSQGGEGTADLPLEQQGDDAPHWKVGSCPVLDL